MGAVDVAYEAIRARISTGDFPTGHHLREEELAEIIGVSRTPIREALRRLGAEGLVEYHKNRGAQVAAWSDQDLEEIFGLRALLESYAARLAAQRLQPAELARLTELADEMDAVTATGEDGYVDVISKLNNEFHQLVLAGAGNRRLSNLLAGLVQVPLVHRTLSRYSEEQLLRSMAHHRELVAAFGARDPAWAESVMRSHILAARNVLL
jgi:DNA-binding GntR family transcriptional regulator